VRGNGFLALFPYLLLTALFYPALKEIAEICWTNEDYSHGLLLPFIAAYLVWEKRGAIRQAGRESTPPLSLWGVILLMLAAGGYLVSAPSALVFPLWIAFFIALLGTNLLVFGGATARVLLAPTLLLFMAKPLPDSIVPRLFWPLQVLAAKIGGYTLDLLQVPVHMVGNIIEIPGMKLMVEEACSGIRSLMALLTVAFIVITVLEMPRWAKGVIVALSLITAVFLNVVRVALTGVLAHFYDPSTATGFFHTFSGLIVFLVGLGVVYGLALFFTPSHTIKHSPTREP
jgi:exosortase